MRNLGREALGIPLLHIRLLILTEKLLPIAMWLNRIKLCMEVLDELIKIAVNQLFFYLRWDT